MERKSLSEMLEEDKTDYDKILKSLDKGKIDFNKITVDKIKANSIKVGAMNPNREEPKTLTVKVSQNLHRVLRQKMLDENKTMQNYLFNLIIKDLGIRKEKEHV